MSGLTDMSKGRVAALYEGRFAAFLFLRLNTLSLLDSLLSKFRHIYGGIWEIVRLSVCGLFVESLSLVRMNYSVTCGLTLGKRGSNVRYVQKSSCALITCPNIEKFTKSRLNLVYTWELYSVVYFNRTPPFCLYSNKVQRRSTTVQIF